MARRGTRPGHPAGARVPPTLSSRKPREATERSRVIRDPLQNLLLRLVGWITRNCTRSHQLYTCVSPCRGRKTPVAGQQRGIEYLGQRNVARVIGGEILP
jgi:hypothetical protein